MRGAVPPAEIRLREHVRILPSPLETNRRRVSSARLNSRRMKYTLSFLDEKVHASIVTDEDRGMFSIAWSRELTPLEKRTLRAEFVAWRNPILQKLADRH